MQQQQQAAPEWFLQYQATAATRFQALEGECTALRAECTSLRAECTSLRGQLRARDFVIDAVAPLVEHDGLIQNGIFIEKWKLQFVLESGMFAGASEETQIKEFWTVWRTAKWGKGRAAKASPWPTQLQHYVECALRPSPRCSACTPLPITGALRC